MLGLASRARASSTRLGQFRQVPLSEALLDNLYNPGVDFERKRQFTRRRACSAILHEFNSEVPRSRIQAVAARSSSSEDGV